MKLIKADVKFIKTLVNNCY